MTVHWSGGAVDRPAAALEHGAALAARLLAGNPDLHLRQVHCPASRGALAGATVSLAARGGPAGRRTPGSWPTGWRPAPRCCWCATPGTWPVRDVGPGHSFQVGCPASGLDPVDFHPDSPALRQVLRSVGGDGARWEPPEVVTCRRATPSTGVEPGFELAVRAAGPAGTGTALHRVLVARPEALSAARGRPVPAVAARRRQDR